MTPGNPNDPIDIEPDFEEFSDETGLDAVEGDFDDDAEIYDENWDEDAAPVEQPVRAKKKSSLFTILLIGGAVVIGGGILAFQLGGKPQSPAAPAAEQTAQTPDAAPDAAPNAAPGPDQSGLMAMQQNPGDQPPAADPASSPETPVAPATKGFMDDPGQLDASTVQQATGQAPGLPEQGPSMTGLEEPAPADGQTLAQAPVVSEAPADLPVPQNLPNIDQIKKAAPVSETPVAEASAPDITAPAPVTSAPDMATSTTANSARETELQSKLDKASVRIAALEKKLSEKLQPEKGNSEEVADLRSTIEKLEDKVSMLTAKASSNSDMVSEEPARPVVKKAAPKKKKGPVEGSYSSAKWELRGARPGEAMIGKSGQAGLQTIRVGDTMVGIGQVRSIAQSGGIWVVQGTSGSISQ